MASAVVGRIVFRLSIFFLGEVRESGDGSEESRRHVHARGSFAWSSELSASPGTVGEYQFGTGLRDGETSGIGLATATGKAGADFAWQVSLIRSSQANAFCLPGGKIVVYTGILPITQNEPALATVLGHEMAHATSRHGSQRVLEQNLAQTALTGVAMSLSDMDYDKQRAVMGALGAGTQFGVLMPFSRKHESEADEIGLLYMARAGYDPRESIRFWQRMENAGGAQPPEFLSSHPSHGTRIQQLEAEMPKALEEYSKSSHADAPASL